MFWFKFSYRLVIACMLSFPLTAIADDIIQVRFSSDAVVPMVTMTNGKLSAVSFRDTKLKNIFSRYVIKSCLQSYPLVINIPHSLSPLLNRVYEFVLASGGVSLMNDLDDDGGHAVVNKYLIRAPAQLVMPDDYNSDAIPCGSGAQRLRHLDLIGAPEAWDVTTGSPDVKIAVMDNGFNKHHEDLIGKIANAGTHTGFETHGTTVLGHVAANTGNGIGQSAIGYNCQLLAYESGFKHFPQAILAGAKVINCSWYISCTANQNDQQMIKVAHDMGVVVVAAAGNGGTCGAADRYVYPASYDHVISVTGVGHYFPRNQSDPCNGKINHEDVHLYRSGYSGPYQTLQHNDKVDLAAPAYEVRSLSLSSYWNVSGSSFAAPIVSGVCGLLFSIYKDFIPEEIEGILKCTAVDLDNIPENAAYKGLLGAGRVNAHAAVVKANQMLTNRPADIIWHYYNKRGNKIMFDPKQLYLHVRAGSVAGNRIFAEAVSKSPGDDFRWEFKKGECIIRKSGNPVSFDLTAECAAFWYTLEAKVSNQVAGICDPRASVSYSEVAYLNEGADCSQPYRCFEWVKRTGASTNINARADGNNVPLGRTRPGGRASPASGPTANHDLDHVVIYPNPASSVVTIQIPPAMIVAKARILSATGKLIAAITLTSDKAVFSIKGLPSGIYFIRISGNRGTIVKKLLVAYPALTLQP